MMVRRPTVTFVFGQPPGGDGVVSSLFWGKEDYVCMYLCRYVLILTVRDLGSRAEHYVLLFYCIRCIYPYRISLCRGVGSLQMSGTGKR